MRRVLGNAAVRCFTWLTPLLLALSGGSGAGDNLGNYPSRPIRMVVPFSAGSIVDVRARQISERLAKNINRPVIVDNRPGATTIIGADLVAKSRPDGYTILMASSATFTITPLLVKSLPFDPVKDFVPITQYGSGSLVLVVHPSLGISSVKELIVRAKARPGELRHASPGAGTNAGITPEIFKRAAGIDMEAVVYRSEAPALADVVAGHVPMIFSFAATARPFISQGRLRALMQTGPKRLRVLPDVPTASEVGLPDATVTTWGGFWAPAGTPQHIVNWLSAELGKVILSVEFKKLMEDSGSEAHASTPDQFRAFIESERQRWARIIRTAGIKAEE